MPDELDPTPAPPPEAPSNVAELLPFLPVSYEFGQQWAMVFSQELADILAERQAENPQQFVAKPVQLTTGDWFLAGDILSEVPNGLYKVGFATLDQSRFSEISVVPIANALALLPVVEEPVE